MTNFTVSWQLSDWNVDNNNFTVGGDIEGAFEGQLFANKILAESSWLFNLNY
jgi:hypothetical protein